VFKKANAFESNLFLIAVEKISDIFLQQSKFEDAVQYIFELINESQVTPLIQIKLFTNIGQRYKRLEQYYKGAQYFRKALHLAKTLGDTEVIKSMSVFAEILDMAGDKELALNSKIKVRRMMKSVNHPTSELDIQMSNNFSHKEAYRLSHQDQGLNVI